LRSMIILPTVPNRLLAPRFWFYRSPLFRPRRPGFVAPPSRQEKKNGTQRWQTIPGTVWAVEEMKVKPSSHVRALRSAATSSPFMQTPYPSVLCERSKDVYVKKSQTVQNLLLNIGDFTMHVSMEETEDTRWST
jgi:hypothetical protein